MNQVRFRAFNGDELVAESEWADESHPSHAPNALAKFRKTLDGNYAYRIERTGDSKVPNKIQTFRYRIKVGENVYYSRLITKQERASALLEINEMFPNGEITEEGV